MKNLSKNVQECNGNITDLKANLHSVVSGTVKDILDERHEESARVNNLIFFNLKDNGNISTDKDTLKSILEEVLGLPGAIGHVDASSITRLGKFDNKSMKVRPLRVRIEKRDIRGVILRNAFRMKNNEQFSKVGIGRDLTVKQRETNRELRNELAIKRKDDPNKNWGIRRDKIVELPKVTHTDAAGDGKAN